MNKIFVSIGIFSIVIGNIFGSSLAARGGFNSLNEINALTSRNQYADRVNDIAYEKKSENDELKIEVGNEYAENMKDILETEKLDPKLTLKENIDKLKLKVVKVKGVADAKEYAKKKATTDKNYVVKQINNSNILSMYEISEDFPYYVKDGTEEKETLQRLDYAGSYQEAYKYHYEEIVTKFPEMGLSRVRNYKFITMTKNKKEKSESFNFEEGGVIFVDEKVDIENVKPEDLYIVSFSKYISTDTMKIVISAHNKKVRKDNGIEEPKEKQPDKKQQTTTQKKTTTSPTNKNNNKTNNTQPIKSRSELMRGLR